MLNGSEEEEGTANDVLNSKNKTATTASTAIVAKVRE